MPKAPPPRPRYPNFSLPDGWDTTWQAAKAAAGSSPANLLLLGDSITWGSNSSDFLNKSWASLLQAQLVAQYGLGAEFLPHYSYCVGAQNPTGSMPWNSLAGHYTASPLAVFGYGRCQSINTAQNQTFTSRNACTALDLLYLDYAAGSFTYSLDGAAAVTVNTVGPGTSGGATVQRIRLSGLASQVHTLQLAGANANSILFPLGIVEYPAGIAGAGICIARCGYSGIQAYNWAAAAPQLATDLWRGKIPQMDLIPAPITAPAGSLAAGGSIEVGQRWYVYTTYNTNVSILTESLPSPVFTITPTGGNQTVNLTGIAVRTGGAASNHRRLYRTKIGGTSAGPFFLVTELADNTTTTFADTLADASLGAGQPPASYTVANTGFGFPTQPHLAIIELGVNDANNGITTAQLQQQLVNTIRSIRRGQAGASILLYLASYPDGVSSDVPNTTFATGAALWHSFKIALRDIAHAYGCAVMDIDSRWGELGVSLGYQTTDVHPTDAGHADIAAQLLSVL